MSNKVFYKNPERNTQERVPKYVPQYKTLDVEPHEYHTSKVPANTPVAKTGVPQTTRDKGRAYAEVPQQHKMSSIPNVGNNMPNVWSGMDGEIVDDLSEFKIDPRAKMVERSHEAQEVLNILKSSVSDDNVILSALHELQEENYILLAKGQLVCSGSLSDVESEVRNLVLGEHAIEFEEVIVLKKAKVKMGVFIE